MPTRCNRGFIADIITCSTCFGHHYAHHQELKIIIQWLLPVVFRAVVFKLLRVMCPVCRMLQQPLYNTLELLMMGIVVSETCYEQAIRSAIKTSVASSWQLLLSLYLLLFFFLFSKSCPFWTLLLFEFSVLTSEIFLCFLLVHPSKLFVHCGRLSM